MNILLVTNLFPTPIDPERGVFTLQLVKSLQTMANVTVVCPLPYFPKLPFLSKLKKWHGFSLVPEQYDIDGVKVYSPKYPLIPKISESNHAKLMSFGIKSCIEKLHKLYKFDVINSQWMFPDSCAVDLIIDKLSIPHVATGLGCDINHDLYDSSKRSSILRMLARSKAITVVSNSLKEELIKSDIDNNKISVIANGVDTSQFKVLNKPECRNELNLEIERPMLLFVGRLSEEKGLSSFIQAISELVKQGQKLKYYIVGDGPLLDELINQSESLNLTESIIFVGKVEHSEVSKWMGAADYFCLPSLREGCPNVILEALGCGKPIIASRVGAIPDIVTDDTGVLFKAEDIDGIQAAIKVALSKTWDSKKISKSIENYSWNHAAKNYINVFNKCI